MRTPFNIVLNKEYTRETIIQNYNATCTINRGAIVDVSIIVSTASVFHADYIYYSKTHLN